MDKLPMFNNLKGVIAVKVAVFFLTEILYLMKATQKIFRH